MANRTVKDATSIHGTNPQYLVEKIIRTRIYDSKYWKEECFALTAELLVDKAMELRAVGGVFGGNIKPTPFICLILKMLQIQPEKDIIIEFIKQDEFKYVRALGAFYLRLVYSSLDCYKYLEPLLNDYRKLRSLDRSGQYSLTSMDEFIDDLLREERYCDVILPRIQKRWVHEECNELEGRVSLLDDDLEDLESESEDEEIPPPPPKPEPVRPAPREEKHSRGAHSPSRRSPGREIMRTERDREREREKRHRSRSRSRERERTKRHRSRSRERRHRSPVAIKKIEMHGSFPRGHAYNHHHRESEREREAMRNPLYRRDHREERPQRDSHRNRGEIERGRVRERERLERPERMERMERLERLERPERAMRERDHYGRERGREREREREGNREHRERKSEKESRKEKHRSEKKDRREANGMSKEDLEIAEANSLRAQLGLPPLKP